MSIIETLTEGMVNRNMEAEGAALLNKWTQTGLLEGLDAAKAQNMAVLLENQAKSLLKESSALAGGGIDGFAAVAFPIVRRVFAGLIANDLVSVQPMSLPSGLIFFLDFTYSANLGATTTGGPRGGNAINKSIYGTNQTGSGIIDGVDLVNATTKAGFGGPGRDGQTGYAYASPTGSNTAIISGGAALAMTRVFLLDGAEADSDKKMLQYDPDLLSLTDSTGVVVLDVAKSTITTPEGDPDFDNLSPFLIDLTSSLQVAGLSGGTPVFNKIRRLTDKVSATDSQLSVESIRFVYSMTPGGATIAANASANLATAINIVDTEYPVKDSIIAAAGGAIGAVEGSLFGLEGNANIPEIDIKVDSTAITAQTKKLKAKWTPELGQDLNAYHNIDAEVELTSILSEQIALEIDREILADLVNGATAATYYWSRSPGLFLNRSTGAEIGASSAAPDFTGTVSEWYETLIETVNDVSAQIHRKTLRGGATHVVCGPEVANILEFTAGFRANVTADADRGDIGAVKAGSLNRKFDVIVDPYFPRNVLLIGRIGSSFLESGYVYAPYVPLQVTPTIFGVEDFVPRKGVMTRYAKKMVRPDMYGLVIVRGLLGEAGATS
jgi:hypothetical protein